MNDNKNRIRPVVVVPARLGSNRVKAKNLRLLNGKPLIEYILDTLKDTQFLTDIYINSESDYFKIIADRNFVNFYKRPPELATSKSLIDEYIYNFIINENAAYLAVVNPTSPFISSSHLDDAWSYFIENDFDTLLSCERIQTHCFFKGEPINFSIDGKHPRSQDLEPVRALNFAITIWDCKKYIDNYEQNGYGVYTGKLGFFDTEGIGNIDIDYEEDFLFAEFVARYIKSGVEINAEYSDIVKNLIEQNIKIEN